MRSYSVSCCILLAVLAGCAPRHSPLPPDENVPFERKEKEKPAPPDKPNKEETKQSDKTPKSDKHAGDVASGPDLRMPGHFEVKTITGEVKGDKVCYYCEFAKKQLPGGVVIFSRKVDDNVATVLKALDGVQERHPKLGTVLVGIDNVSEAELQQFQARHKLKMPLTISTEKTGVARHKLNQDAVVTVLVYALGGPIHKSFGYRSTESAAAQASEIAAAAKAVIDKAQ